MTQSCLSEAQCLKMNGAIFIIINISCLKLNLMPTARKCTTHTTHCILRLYFDSKPNGFNWQISDWKLNDFRQTPNSAPNKNDLLLLLNSFCMNYQASKCTIKHIEYEFFCAIRYTWLNVTKKWQKLIPINHFKCFQNRA